MNSVRLVETRETSEVRRGVRERMAIRPMYYRSLAACGGLFAVHFAFGLWLFPTAAPRARALAPPPAERRNEEINLPLMPSSFVSVRPPSVRPSRRVAEGPRDTGTTSAMDGGGDAGRMCTYCNIIHSYCNCRSHLQQKCQTYIALNAGTIFPESSFEK